MKKLITIGLILFVAGITFGQLYPMKYDASGVIQGADVIIPANDLLTKTEADSTYETDAPEGTVIKSTGAADNLVLTADGLGRSVWRTSSTSDTPEGDALLATGVPDGLVLTAGSGVTSWQSPASGGAFINAQDYGAVGDCNSNGVGTDDTTALQAAIDAAEAAKLPLFIPPGRYKISSALTFVPTINGSIIRGAGESATIIHNVTDDTDSFVFDASGGGLEGLKFQDMTITRTWGSNRTGVGLTVDGGASTCARVFITGVQINFYSTGLLLDGCDQSVVIGGRYAACDKGIDVTGNSNAINFFNLIFNDNTVCGIHIQQGTGANILGCDMGNSYYAAPQVIVDNSSTTITGCNFEMHKDSPAIVLYAEDNTCRITVDTCHFYNLAVTGQDPTWNYPALVAAVHPSTPGKYPTIMWRNNMTYPSTAQPAVRVWDKNITVVGLSNDIDPDGTSANRYHYEIVDGTYPTVGSVKERRIISPIPVSETASSVSINQAGMLYWKADLTSTGPDDLMVTYPLTDSTYAESSLINKNLLSSVNTWTAAQDFTGGLTVDGQDIDGFIEVANVKQRRTATVASCGVDADHIVLYAAADMFDDGLLNDGEYFAYTDVNNPENCFVGRLVNSGTFVAPNDTSALPASTPTTVNGVVNWESTFGSGATVYWIQLEMAFLSNHSSNDDLGRATTPWAFVTQLEDQAGGHGGRPIMANPNLAGASLIYDLWAYDNDDYTHTEGVLGDANSTGSAETISNGGHGGGRYSSFILQGQFDDNASVLMMANDINLPADGNSLKVISYKIKIHNGDVATTVFNENP